MLITVFEHTLSNLRFGVPSHQVRAQNFQTYFETSTSATSTAEFSIAHGLPNTPRGEKNRLAKLTREQVEALRRDYAAGVLNQESKDNILW